MSFALTLDQMFAREKDITRRFGWWFLKPGDQVMAVKKAMGLKAGEKIERIGLIEIVSTRAEPLDAISHDDCRREGFPDFYPADFVGMLTSHYGCEDDKTVNRIEFRHLY